MTPDFLIRVDGEDRTAVFRDRLLRLTVVDEDGDKADRIEIELDDRENRIAWPEEDARIEIALGFQDQSLNAMGVFAVDGLSGTGPALTLRVTATAADLKGEIRAPKTRSWENVTLAQIVRDIAAAVGLRPVVGASIAATRWPWLAQTAESDLHFLSRIAATLDATAKPAGGALVVQKRGEGQTAAGDKIEAPELRPMCLSDWSWSVDGRTVYRAAEAEWTDTATGITHKVKAGSGTPLKKIRHPYPTEAEATRAAESALIGAERAAMTLDATIAGFEPRLFGGGLVRMAGLRAELDGDWHLKNVTHELSSAGLITSIQATKGRPDAT